MGSNERPRDYEPEFNLRHHEGEILNHATMLFSIHRLHSSTLKNTSTTHEQDGDLQPIVWTDLVGISRLHSIHMDVFCLLFLL